MSINIQAKPDMSFLFSSLGSGAAGVAGSNFLSDYASIKNGSYGKLMKAYFGGSANSSVKSIAKNSSADKTGGTGTTALSKEDTKAYNKVQTSTDALKNSADALLATGSKSVFAKKDITTKDENGVETTVKDYDRDAIYSAVNSFVTNYNALVTATDKVDDNAVERRTATMLNETTSNLKSLLAVGISINGDGTLSLDKDDFMKSEMTTVKSLFNGNGSYAYKVSTQASMINYAAENAVSKGYSYTAAGKYGTGLGTGNLYNGWM